MLESQDVTSLPDFVEVPRLLEGSLFSLEFWKPPRKENARISVVIVPDRSIALCSLSYPSARRLDTALVAEFFFLPQGGVFSQKFRYGVIQPQHRVIDAENNILLCNQNRSQANIFTTWAEAILLAL
jgi:hypothetical protein